MRVAMAKFRIPELGGEKAFGSHWPWFESKCVR